MANNWECDELGHLNMRYYMAKVEEARQMFVMRLGLRKAFKANAASTVQLKEFHIKYMKEALPGAQLYIETGLAGLEAESLKLVHIIYHANGDIAATVIETLDHIYGRTGRTFPWPSRVREQATSLTVDVPDIAKPKGLSGQEVMSGPGLDHLKNWGCQHVGTGVFLRSETDIFGHIPAQALMGRLSDCIGMFSDGWPDFDPTDWMGAESMGVILELRFRIHKPVRSGDPFEIYSGVGHVNKKIRQLTHNFVNPFTGQSYATGMAVNGLIHMKERRLVSADPETLVKLEAVANPDLHG